MNRYIALLIVTTLTWQAQAQMPCAELEQLRLPDVNITEATLVEPATPPAPVTVAHCRVVGSIGGTIGFEVLLPKDWNGRFFMGGGGGYVGQITNSAQPAVDLGYASAGTDTGHQGDGLEADWALNDPVAQLNFGHLAIHRTAEVAKSVILAHYGSDPAYSYFFGCSRGGGQAMMEAQRYPDDFDGIVAGAPAMDWPGFAAEFIQNIQLNYPDPAHLSEPIITKENLALIETSILKACDGLDGVVDGMMENPRACPFDLETVPACEAGRPGPDCMTALQRAAIERVYAPVVSDHGVVHPGQPFGGEGDFDNGWLPWITGVFEPVFASSQERFPSLQFAFGTELFKYFVYGDPDWDYVRYDLNRVPDDTRTVAQMLNSTDPDLSAYKTRGGKLILWHGWSDPALSAYASIDYYKEVEGLDPTLRDYFRLFLMPGVLHCGSGVGPDQVEWYTAIADWVERGIPPQKIVAKKMNAEGDTVMTRPLCPYPQQARYIGNGNTNEASRFECR
ncbi:MAG: tannase/feruloyl esterase family alpha/beta hydrolase [Rhodothermales bacterium]|nr:tannase/feruloyl esterase family alpha/beta hydrolase [Rhodothermales bacterium]